ncbi:hypothetical protein EV360DRAFT_77750 [Lentinula raphanica]|nr:hypothetical protein EV360DRAFT_77750 [Lentinula raphanica]
MLRPVPPSIRWLHFTSSSASALLHRSNNGQYMRQLTQRSFHRSLPSQSISSSSLLSRLSRRILYKKDGITPRSKRRGLVLAGWLSLTGLLLYTTASLLADVEDLVLLLAAFIQLQQVDASSYSPSHPDSKERNWEDWKESITYFQSICKPVLVTLTWADPDHLDRFFAELESVVDQLDNIDISHGRAGPGTETLKAKIHGIMNGASHAVHRSLLALQQTFGNPKSPPPSDWMKSASSPHLSSGGVGAEVTIEGASETVQHIREAIEAILQALQDRLDRAVSGEIDREMSAWFKVKGDGGGKGSKGKGYDIIG